MNVLVLAIYCYIGQDKLSNNMLIELTFLLKRQYYLNSDIYFSLQFIHITIYTPSGIQSYISKMNASGKATCHFEAYMILNVNKCYAI